MPVCTVCTMLKGGWTEKPEEAGSQEPGKAGAADATSVALMKLLREQLKAQQTQQEMLIALLEQQKEEMMQYRKELTSLREQAEAKSPAEGAVMATRVPKPTLQKLSPDDDIEHFLTTFKRIAVQQEWPAEECMGNSACGPPDGEGHGCLYESQQ